MENIPNNLKVDFNKIYTVDTNIILHDAHNIEMLSENGKNLICIPETVIDEIDNKKYGLEEINYQAREFARLLEDATIKAHRIIKTQTGEYSIIEICLDKDGKNTYIHMVSKKEYLQNERNTKVSILNDRKILEIARFIEKEYKEAISENFNNTKVRFLSLDIIARTRAISMGLTSEGLLNNKKDEDFNFSFMKEIEVLSDELTSINGKDITSIDPDYVKTNFVYLLKGDKGHMEYALIKNGKIEYIDQEELKQQYVNPRNTEQKCLSAALLDPYYDIVAVDSQAGTGKTLLSVSAGMKNIKKGRHSKIVYIRNSVESVDLKSEEIGFLPGSIEDKLKVYNYALYDSIEYIARKEVSKKNKNERNERDVIEKMDEIMSKYNFETMWPGELRGRTIQESYVIVDEAQNFSKKGLATVLSRIDSSCKVIVLGNWKQVDNSYLNKYSNGLSHLLSLMSEDKEMVNLFGMELKKVLRGPITEWVEEVYNRQSK